jgi:hypothetical protein
MSWPNLEAAIKTLGFTHLSPEGLTAIERKLGDQSHETRREFREFMWELGRMFADPDESTEDRYWRVICYVREKMRDLELIAADDDPALRHAIVQDVLKRTTQP